MESNCKGEPGNRQQQQHKTRERLPTPGTRKLRHVQIGEERQPRRSSALPSSQTHLSERASVARLSVWSMPPPSSLSTPPNAEDTNQEEQAQGQVSVVPEEGRRGEEQEQLLIVEYEQQPRATPQ